MKKSNPSQDRLTAEVCRTTSVLQRFPATDPSGAPSKADFEHPPTVRAAPKRLVDAQSRWLGEIEDLLDVTLDELGSPRPGEASPWKLVLADGRTLSR